MLGEAARRFAALSTPVKLFLILSAALLPIGLGLVWAASQGIRDANNVIEDQAHEQARLASRGVESLIARNALALRIASNGRITNSADACSIVQQSLTVTPAVAQRFELEDENGQRLCEVGNVPETARLSLVAPGDIALKILPEDEALGFRVGVVGGLATGALSRADLKKAALDAAPNVQGLTLRDRQSELQIVAPSALDDPAQKLVTSKWPLANGRLEMVVTTKLPMITTGDRLLLLLPFLMWIVAALLTWVLVTRLLIGPLRMLQRAVVNYEPGNEELALPQKLGPATEIQDLRDAFERAMERVEGSEREMAGALEGQRRLVREVHHRVKNNLQVVASLINIHGRTAETPPARAAYGSISRRVGALAIVHRNHFAEMEENRGISLRPLLSELAAELRATAPDSARGMRIELDLEGANTTQDVAVSVAFLVTEIVEFAMLRTPEDPVEISLRRTSELTARLTLNSKVLNPDEEGDREKDQFERIISGLGKQLRSVLERKLGRYSVEIPVFPPL
ncbi:sensor histidine kinase [Sphingomonas daechungensis]|uniref:sensor histidine kinase n=1 Tax=Sphingomonas daechungensis TaxID=1176646 RepID=UPI0037844F51